jgi:hypothetical protein
MSLPFRAMNFGRDPKTINIDGRANPAQLVRSILPCILMVTLGVWFFNILLGRLEYFGGAPGGE